MTTPTCIIVNGSRLPVSTPWTLPRCANEINTRFFLSLLYGSMTAVPRLCSTFAWARGRALFLPIILLACRNWFSVIIIITDKLCITVCVYVLARPYGSHNQWILTSYLLTTAVVHTPISSALEHGTMALVIIISWPQLLLSWFGNSNSLSYQCAKSVPCLPCVSLHTISHLYNFVLTKIHVMYIGGKGNEPPMVTWDRRLVWLLIATSQHVQ